MQKTPLSVNKVTPITLHLKSGGLVDIQVAPLFAMGFFGFVQWDDLSKVVVDNLLFSESPVAVFLQQKKNDQFWKGSGVFIASSGVAPCPMGEVPEDGWSSWGVQAVS